MSKSDLQIAKRLLGPWFETFEECPLGLGRWCLGVRKEPCGEMFVFKSLRHVQQWVEKRNGGV